MKQNSVSLIAAVFTLLIAGCSGSSDNFDLGEVKNGKYHNGFFGMTVSLPKGWTVLDPELVNAKADEAKKILAKGDSARADRFEKAVQQGVNLFTVSKYPTVASPSTGNAIITCLATKENLSPEFVPDSELYLRKAKDGLYDAKVRFRIRQDITTQFLGDTAFATMTIDVDAPSIMHTKYYSVVIKRYGIGVIAYYLTDEDEKVIDQVLQSITFDQ